MRLWLRDRSLPVKVLVYAALATLTFALAAGVGAAGVLALRGDVVGLLEADQAPPTDGQDAAGSGVASGAADPKTADEGTASGAAQGTEGADPGATVGEEATFVHAATDENSRGRNTT